MTADLTSIAKAARNASNVMAAADSATKNRALELVRAKLLANKEVILAANVADKEAASANKLDNALQKRLELGGDKYETLLAGLDSVIRLDDPVNKVSLARELDQGLNMYRVACPVGVLCIIFESRPEAAVQISSLAIKSGNAVILKGGKEAVKSNTEIVKALQAGLEEAGLPKEAVQLVTTREAVGGLLKMDEYVDLIIPRGSNQLVKSIMNNTSIPVMGHADGICHVYLDEFADVDKAARVIVDAKTNYCAACNAAETLLVHENALDMLKQVGAALASKGVVMHADDTCIKYLPKDSAVAATEGTFRTEYLTFDISVKVVKSLEAAVEHINTFGSHHTDVILTEDLRNAETFMQSVGSAGVYHNASSRFADGFRYGFGAEVGVSTNRIHARGPVGLEGLLIYKYRMHGDGHCAADYGVKEGQRQYTHKDLPIPADGYVQRLDQPVASLREVVTEFLTDGRGQAVALFSAVALIAMALTK